MFAAAISKSLEVVLGDVEAISGTPIYFHNNAGKDFCANRSGRLIVYHGPIGDLVTVYNDGGIYYRNSPIPRVQSTASFNSGTF
jgi:glutamate synthase domain-containing protein 3